MAQALKIAHMLCCSLLIMAITTTMLCAARPQSHGFGTNPDTAQNTNELELGNAGISNEFPHFTRNSYLDADDIQALRLRLLAQQLALGGGLGSNEIDAMLPPNKRQAQQARFRQCYFNPISCFRK